MNRYLLDTNIVSYLSRRNLNVQEKVAALEAHGALCISVITEAELRYGLAKRSVSRDTQLAVEGLIAATQVLAWTSECALAYAELRVRNEAAGWTVGEYDLLIAAQAKAEGATLVTSDKTLAEMSGPDVLLW